MLLSALAARAADADIKGEIVLVVVVELCTLAFRADRNAKADVISTALFGDGAAACVLRAGAGGMAEITRSAEHTWPDTLDIMGWNVDPEGFGVIFDRSIPDFMLARLEPALRLVLAGMRLDPARVARYVCHPGGAKVIVALETVLDLPAGALDHERRILSKFGNMSAPTALFVLESLAREGLPCVHLRARQMPLCKRGCVARVDDRSTA